MGKNKEKESKSIEELLEKALILEEYPLVIFSDHIKVIKCLDSDFIQGSDVVKALISNQTYNPKFFYYPITQRITTNS